MRLGQRRRPEPGLMPGAGAGHTAPPSCALPGSGSVSAAGPAGAHWRRWLVSRQGKMRPRQRSDRVRVVGDDDPRPVLLVLDQAGRLRNPTGDVLRVPSLGSAGSLIPTVRAGGRDQARCHLAVLRRAAEVRAAGVLNGLPALAAEMVCDVRPTGWTSRRAAPAPPGQGTTVCWAERTRPRGDQREADRRWGTAETRLRN